MNRLRTAIGLALLTAGCGGGSPSGPTSQAERPAEPTYTLSGVIVANTAAGLVPLEGVLVQINMLKPAITDSAGFYSIPGLTLGGLSQNTAIGPFNTVTAWKPTYVNDSRTVTIAGDTRHDIQLVRRPTFTLSGMVFETTPGGVVPVAGVDIHDWSCDPVFPGNRPPNPSDGCSAGHGQSTTTDARGRYTFPGVYASRNLVCAMKAGYEGNAADPECAGYSSSLMLSGDTEFDIQLARPPEPAEAGPHE